MMRNISLDEQSRRASKSHSRFVKSASHRVSIFERKGLKGKTLFKCIARRAGQFREWLKEIDSYLMGVIRPAAGIAATKKTLSIEAKMILIKNEMLRTAAEQEDLEGFLGGLYFYNRYPEKEYKQLIGKTNCCAYGGGRTVLRQGHALSGQSRLYYVVTGNLSVEIETVDPITLASHVEVVKKLGPGDHFGDKAIIFNEDRESTVITLSDVMLLYITKEDFDAILKESLEKTWSQVRKATTELSYFFGDWTDAEIRRCSIISELITFQEGDLILGDGYGKRKNAHFIVEGQCSMIQDIEVEERGNSWKLVKSNDTENINSDDSSKRRQHVYLQTNVFSKGACFGVGEKMNNRRYVAESDVQCLVVPQYLLIAHNRFETYKQFLESRLLSTEQLYSNFIYSRRRLEYKAKKIHGSKMDGSMGEMIERFSRANSQDSLDDERMRKYKGSRFGENNLPIRKSPSRIMAELTEKLGNCTEVDFSEMLNKNTNDDRNLMVDLPMFIAQLTRERNRRRDLEKTLADGLEFCFKLEKHKHHLRKRLTNLKSENTRLQAELYEIQDKNKSIEDKMDDKEERYNSLRIEMIEKKHENIESQMRIFEMEKEIDSLKSQLSNASDELIEARDMIAKLQSDVAKLERTVPIEDNKDEEYRYDREFHQYIVEDELREIQELEESALSFQP